MAHINEDNLATLEFQLTWTSDIGRHTETYLAEHVNFWRDLLPDRVYRTLMGNSPGDRLLFSLGPKDIMLAHEPKQIVTLDSGRFERRKVNGHRIEPRIGRFYPKGLLKGLPNVFEHNIEPCRCVGVNSSHIVVDLNHPFAGKEIDLEVIVRDVREKTSDRGGRLTDWLETVTDGPGMQVRWNGNPTDFFSDSPFVRPDEKDDCIFYEKPRLVTHVDGQAIEIIGTIYGRILKPGMRVLDLMGSWRSHVPESIQLESLVGLGMNPKEMEDNLQLTGHVVHDLNANPRLPFDDRSFDAVICSVSVEYMTRPFEVFKDVARILRPKGYFIHTFSNRWFPPKAIRMWTELSEFERMGLVLEYFLDSGAYENLETFSARGWPRPVTNRYYPEITTADPVYGVWGHTV